MTGLFLATYGALATPFFPVAAAALAARPRSREVWRARLGLSLPRALPRRGERLWVHALSVGEALSALPLVSAVKDIAPGCEVVFSTATATGARVARERLAPHVSLFFTLPFDFPWAALEVARRVAPTRFALIETDVWPGLLAVLKRRGVPAYLLNARMSGGSHAAYMALRPLASRLFGAFSGIFAQGEADAARYAALGVPGGRVRAAGNLKYDLALLQAKAAHPESARLVAGIEAGRPFWVAGSTHGGEEEAVFSAHAAVLRTHPGLLLVLAPRNPARGNELSALSARAGLSASRRSLSEAASGCDVFILDTLGELPHFYAAARAAFIGGSLVPRGGHNPLEAAVHGTPTAFGPHCSNFREIEAELSSAGAGTPVHDAPSLAAFLTKALGDAAFREETARAARALFASRGGVARRIAQAILAPRPPA